MTTENQVKERPILFGGPMVRALLAGTKTQTRRIVKPQPAEDLALVMDDSQAYALTYWHGLIAPDHLAIEGEIKCPYGQPGDRLWVRETWNAWGTYDSLRPAQLPEGTGVAYAADMRTPEAEACGRLRPGMFMPRWASRLLLEIVSVRVERLQDISEADAVGEGVNVVEVYNGNNHYEDYTNEGRFCHFASQSFATLWQSINGPDSWQANPWVWVVEFRRIDAE